MVLGHLEIVGQALNTLLDVPSVPVAIGVRRWVRAMEPHQKEFEEVRLDIIGRHAEIDDDGELVIDDAGNVTLRDPEAFAEEMRELVETEVDLDCKPIPADVLEGVLEVNPHLPISARTLLVLSEFGVVA